MISILAPGNRIKCGTSMAVMKNESAEIFRREEENHP